MKTFKQFITEHDDGSNVQVEWKVSSPRLDVELLIPFVKRHCPKMMRNMIDNKRYLYRGFINDILKQGRDFAIVDTTDSKRKSRHSNNAYQVLLSMANELAHIPDRTTSMICSTSRSTAGLYSNNVRLIIPFDDATLAYTPNVDDILYRGGIQINGMKVEFAGLNKAIGFLAHAFGIQKSAAEITPEIINKIDDNLKMMRPEWLFIQIADSFYGTYKLRHDLVKSTPSVILTKIMELQDIDEQSFWPKGQSKFNWFSEACSKIDFEKELTSKGAQLYSWIKSKQDTGLIASIAEMMSESSTGIVAHDTSKPLPPSTEVWFTGHALVMTELKFKELIAKYEANV